MTTIEKKRLVGDCECCTKSVNVELFTLNGMQMCENCRNVQIAAVSTKVGEINQILQSSAQIDTSIKLKADIWNSKTPALVELRAAIENDANIPSDQKQFAYVKTTYDKFVHLKSVVFKKRQELLEEENELRVLQSDIQTNAAKLRAEERAKFKSLDLTYEAKTPKTVKPASSPAAKFKRAELIEAAIKYGVNKDVLRMICKESGLSPEAAAREASRTKKRIVEDNTPTVESVAESIADELVSVTDESKDE